MDNLKKYNDYNSDLMSGAGLENYVEHDQNFYNVVKDLDKNVQNVDVLSQTDYNSTVSQKNTLYFIDDISEDEGTKKKILDIAIYQPYSMLKHPYEFWVLQLDETGSESIIRLLRGDSLINKYIKEEIIKGDDFASFINNTVTKSSVEILNKLKKNYPKKSKIAFYCEREFRSFVGGSLVFDGEFEYTDDGSAAVFRSNSKPFLVLIGSNGSLYLFTNPDEVEGLEVKPSSSNKTITACSVEKGYGNIRNDQGIVVAYIERDTTSESTDVGKIKYIQYKQSEEAINGATVVNNKYFTNPETIELNNFYPNFYPEENNTNKKAISLDVKLRRLTDYRLALTYTYGIYTVENVGDATLEYYSKMLLSDRAFLGVAARQEVLDINNTIINFPGTVTATYGATRNWYYNNEDVDTITPTFSVENASTEVIQKNTALYTDYRMPLSISQKGSYSGLDIIDEKNPVWKEEGLRAPKLDETIEEAVVFPAEGIQSDYASLFEFESSPYQEEGYIYENVVYGWGSYGCASLEGIIPEKSTTTHVAFRFRGGSLSGFNYPIRTVCKIKPEYAKEKSLYIRFKIDNLTAKSDDSSPFIDDEQELGFYNSGGWLAMTDFGEFTIGKQYVVELPPMEVDFSNMKYVVFEMQHFNFKLISGDVDRINKNIEFYINLGYGYNLSNKKSTISIPNNISEFNKGQIEINYAYNANFKSTITIRREIDV